MWDVTLKSVPGSWRTEYDTFVLFSSRPHGDCDDTRVYALPAMPFPRCDEHGLLLDLSFCDDRDGDHTQISFTNPLFFRKMLSDNCHIIRIQHSTFETGEECQYVNTVEVKAGSGHWERYPNILCVKLLGTCHCIHEFAFGGSQLKQS